jgi:hypothetical protein
MVVDAFSIRMPSPLVGKVPLGMPLPWWDRRGELLTVLPLTGDDAGRFGIGDVRPRRVLPPLPTARPAGGGFAPRWTIRLNGDHGIVRAWPACWRLAVWGSRRSTGFKMSGGGLAAAGAPMGMVLRRRPEC